MFFANDILSASKTLPKLFLAGDPFSPFFVLKIFRNLKLTRLRIWCWFWIRSGIGIWRRRGIRIGCRIWCRIRRWCWICSLGLPRPWGSAAPSLGIRGLGCSRGCFPDFVGALDFIRYFPWSSKVFLHGHSWAKVCRQARGPLGLHGEELAIPVSKGYC